MSFPLEDIINSRFGRLRKGRCRRTYSLSFLVLDEDAQASERRE
jgi:hypothetical protein